MQQWNIKVPSNALIEDGRASYPNGIKSDTYRDGGLAASGPGSSEEETSWLKKKRKDVRREEAV